MNKQKTILFFFTLLFGLLVFFGRTFAVDYAVTVTKTGSGSGTVTSSATKVFWDTDLGAQTTSLSSAINCGAVCSGTYPASNPLNADIGRIVTYQDPSEWFNYITLTATPAAGDAFTGWSGDCAGTGTCTVPIGGNHSVTAHFETGFLRVTNYGGGTVTSTGLFSPTLIGSTLGSLGSINGIDCGADCEEAYNKFATVTLTAQPSSPNLFSRWTGCSVSDSDPNICTAVIFGNELVTVHFASLPGFYTLTMEKSEGGNVTGTGINCGTDCYHTVNAASNRRISYTAAAEGGYGFSGWSGDTSLCGANPNCTLVIDPGTGTDTGAPLADIAEANFAPAGCALTKNIIANFSASDLLTCNVTAVPPRIASGESATLNWSSTNASSASFDQRIGSVPENEPGSTPVKPTNTTTYTLTVQDNSGNSKLCSITVTVGAPAAPPAGPGKFLPKKIRELLPF